MFRSLSVLFLLLLLFAAINAQTLSNCRPPPPMPPNAKPGVDGLSLSRDGKTLIVASVDGRIRFVRMQTGQVQKTLTGHTNVVYRGVFSPDETLLASSSRDHTARLWDVASGRELKQVGGFRCSVKAVAFSPNGRLLAASGNDGMLKIWDIASGRELQSLVHRNSADIDMATYSFVFARDGKKIYAGNGDGTISEWDVASGVETRNWKAHENTAYKLEFSRDYGLLASLGDGVVKLWDTSTWREVRTFSLPTEAGATQTSSALAFSNNGRLVAASNIGLDAKQNSYLYIQAVVWEVASGKQVFGTRDHKWDIDGLIFTKDDRFLLTGSVDTTIKFWDVKSGQLARTIKLAP